MSDDYTTYDDLDDTPDVSEVERAEAALVAAQARAELAEAEVLRPNRAQRRAAAKAQPRTARRREAEGIELVAVEHNGHDYWVPADPADWPVAALLGFEDGKAITALRALMEPDEDGRGGFDLLMSTKPRVAELKDLFEKVAKIGGFESSGN